MLGLELIRLSKMGAMKRSVIRLSYPLCMLTGFFQSESCPKAWRRHQTFAALLAICAGNSPFTGELPAQWPATRSFDVFFDLRLNKRLSKQSWGWGFESLSRPLWRHCNEWFCWGLMMHICIFELGHHLFRWWLVFCAAPSHDPNKWGPFVFSYPRNVQ